MLPEAPNKFPLRINLFTEQCPDNLDFVKRKNGHPMTETEKV